MRYLLLSFIVFFSCFQHSASADEMVTVKLVNFVKNCPHLTFEMTGDYYSPVMTVNLKEGVNYQLVVQNGSLYVKEKGKLTNLGSSFFLVPKKYNHEHFIRINGRPYLGAMEFIIENEKYVRPINQLPLEDYLKGVVPFEVFPTWDMEALKAQTLAARTYAITHLHRKMDDTISYQVYGGYSWDERTTKAVEETKGEVIQYKNRLIEAFYSASNGGMTESNKNVWGGEAMPYYPIKEDPYDPINRWDFSLHQTQIDIDQINWDDSKWQSKLKEKDIQISESMKKWLEKQGYDGELNILSISKFALTDEQYPSKRFVKGSITIQFLRQLIDGTVLFETISFENEPLSRIRPMIGGNTFKSYYIEGIEENNGIYRMFGRGFGHGVGMSQWGAHQMGNSGKKYREIIQFYFPNTSIKTISN